MLQSSEIAQMNMFQKVAALAPLLVMGITAFLTFVREHTRKERVVSTLDVASKRVAFWNAWADAHAKLDPSEGHDLARSRALKEIARAAQDAEDIFHATAREEETAARAKASRPWWRRWLLLYKPERAIAWVYRIVFWITLTIFLAFLEPITHDVAVHKLEMGAGIVVLFMFGPPPVISFFLAKHFEVKRASAAGISGRAGEKL